MEMNVGTKAIKIEPHIEERVVSFAIEPPAFGQIPASNKLRKANALDIRDMNLLSGVATHYRIRKGCLTA